MPAGTRAFSGAPDSLKCFVVLTVLQPDDARLDPRTRVLAARSARRAVNPREVGLEDGSFRRISARQPGEAPLAFRTGDDLGFPVHGEGVLSEARALACLPVRVLSHQADDGNSMLGLAADQHLSPGVALVDQVPGGQQTAAAERAMYHFDHVVVRGRSRRGFHVGHQARSRIVAALRKEDLVADP